MEKGKMEEIKRHFGVVAEGLRTRDTPGGGRP
jgi:hypothetical protein